LLPDGFYAMHTNLPKLFALDEAAHVLSSNERNVTAKLRHIEVDQHTSMFVFFRGHVGKDLRRGRMTFPQRLGEIGVDASIFLLAADGKGEDLSLGELIKRSHPQTPFRSILK
jgi:hypothetical protein